MIAAAAALADALAVMGLVVDGSTQARLLQYLRLLEKWNRTYNLTAIESPARMLTHHLLDSLAVLPYVGSGDLLDVGSGGGLPGIPIALVRDDVRVTLLDASQKKCAFLQQAAIELRLAKIEVVHARAESYQHVGGFSQIVSRAFSDLARFVDLTSHLLAADGVWLAMKGVHPAAEIARVTRAQVRRDVVLRVPGLAAERHLIVLEKA